MKDYRKSLSYEMYRLSRFFNSIFLGQQVSVTDFYNTLNKVPKSKRFEMPVAEEMQLGMSIGLALEGFLPISIYQRIDFLPRACDQIVNHLNLINELSRKRKWFLKNVIRKIENGNRYLFAAMGMSLGIIIYYLIRKIKPEILVETGVCNGVSTAFILFALHKNNKGKLYSIDFPMVEGEPYGKYSILSVVPKGKKPGWIIPKYLKRNWELIIGKSQEKLPELVNRLKKIDIFIHDSEHSYDCMWFEFNEVYKVLNDGGTLISHNIDWNNAFYDFSKKYNKKIIKIGKVTGLIVK